MRLTRYGVNYDVIADSYDLNPVRQRGADPELARFIGQRRPESMAILDIGCGTGIQLVANRPQVPGARLVGLDPFFNMLRVAAQKDPSIMWVQGDGMSLPFPGASFDYVTNQFSYHHMARPDLMIAESFRVLRPGGRLVLTNMTPHEAQDTALYEWFPDTLLSDLAAHPRPSDLESFARNAGFVDVDCQVRIVGGDLPLAQVVARYSHKEGCSQLNALPAGVYHSQLRRLQAAAHEDPDSLVSDRTALIRLVADRPSS